MNVLVTGGAGFIGSHLAQELVRAGHQVTIFDNLSTGREDGFTAGCRIVVGDIRDRASLEQSVRGQEVVFHQAAYTSVPGSLENPKECFQTNLEGTRNVLESACRAGVSRVVFASTSALYSDYSDAPRSERDTPQVTSPYARTKLEGEALLHGFHRAKGLSYVALRYFNVYGPRQDAQSAYASVIPIFIFRSQRGENLTVYGDGWQTRDFVYVADVVRANLMAMDSEASGIFNVGTGQAVSILQLAETIIGLTGSGSGHVFAPPRAGDALSSTADITCISSTLGWMPRWDLKRGLVETIRWFGQQNGETSDGRRPQ